MAHLALAQDNFPVSSNTPVTPADAAAPLVTLLERAAAAGLVPNSEKKSAADLQERLGVFAALGMPAPTDASGKIASILAVGAIPEKALDALVQAGLFSAGDTIELRALKTDNSPASSICGVLGDVEGRKALATFIAQNERHNLYVGVNPRPKGHKGEAKATDIAERRNVVLDFDNKDAPPNDPEWKATVAELRGSNPAMIVASGNGTHVWFPIEPVSGKDLGPSGERIKNAVAALGADGISDLPRIIRLPYSVNWPDKTKRARGAVPSLVLPEICNGAATPRKWDVLAAELTNTARSLGLPGKVKAGAANALNGANSNLPDAGPKTPQRAPSMEILQGVLDNLPNVPGGVFDDRSDWVRVAHAIKGAALGTAFEAEAREAFINWSLGWGGDPDKPARAWDSINAPGSDMGPLLGILNRVSPTGYSAVNGALARFAFSESPIDPASIGPSPVEQAVARIRACRTKFVGSRPLHTFPPRKWLYGKFLLAGKLSTVVAPGGVGKSTLVLLDAIAMATGRELVPGWKPRNNLNVWYHNAEDEMEELERRVAAICRRHQVSDTEFGGRLLLSSGMGAGAGGLDLRLTTTVGGRVTIDQAMVDALTAELLTQKINVLILDPLGALHSFDENSNDQINQLMSALREVCAKSGAAILLVHHTGKVAAQNMALAGAGAARGAAALTDASRSTRELIRMSADDAKKWGIADDKRGKLFRVENGKSNFAPAADARWFEMDAVCFNNATVDDEADWVGVPVPWTPPTARQATSADLIAVQGAMRPANADQLRADSKSPGWFGHLVAATIRLDIGAPNSTKDQRNAEQECARIGVANMIQQWERGGWIVKNEVRGADRKSRPSYAIGKDATPFSDVGEAGNIGGRIAPVGDSAENSSVEDIARDGGSVPVPAGADT